MIDLALLREHTQTTTQRIRKKDPRFDVEELVARDKKFESLQ